MKLFTAAVLVLALAATAQALPTGAPVAACTDIFPVGHIAADNTADQSIKFQLSSNFPGGNGTYYYCPGIQHKLTLGPNSTLLFRGLLVQGRNMMGNPVGTFGNFDTLTEASACTPATSAITHSSRVQKSEQNLYWTGPPAGTGPIKFLFAVVIHYTPFANTIINQNYATMETFYIQEGDASSEACMMVASSAGLTASVFTLLIVSLMGLLLQ